MAYKSSSLSSKDKFFNFIMSCQESESSLSSPSTSVHHDDIERHNQTKRRKKRTHPY